MHSVLISLNDSHHQSRHFFSLPLQLLEFQLWWRETKAGEFVKLFTELFRSQLPAWVANFSWLKDQQHHVRIINFHFSYRLSVWLPRYCCVKWLVLILIEITSRWGFTMSFPDSCIRMMEVSIGSWMSGHFGEGSIDVVVVESNSKSSLPNEITVIYFGLRLARLRMMVNNRGNDRSLDRLGSWAGVRADVTSRHLWWPSVLHFHIDDGQLPLGDLWNFLCSLLFF